MLLFPIAFSCKKSILDEKALSFLSPSALKDKAAYESVLVALHATARDEYFKTDGRERYSMVLGTDLARTGDPGLNEWRDYNIEITPSSRTANYWWNWGFIDLLPKANIIISNVQKAETISQEDKNAIEAEARFFRAFAYNALVNMFGGVPIVEQFISEPKNDFVRASREEVLAFAKNDLEFAVQHLPAVAAQQGRITKAAGNHLLSEVYISLSQWDNAIAAASAVINNPSYKLMQQNERFGKYRDSAGTNIFWDLFREGNYNNSANKEAIWVYQFEFGTLGGSTTAGNLGNGSSGNNYYRGLARWFSAKDPDNKDGMTSGGPVALTTTNRFGDKIGDTLVRGVGWLAPTNYWAYSIWTDPNDIRNSNSNIRRKWYYNNPNSAYKGQEVTKHPFLDTLFHINPMVTKFEATNPAGFGQQGVNLDYYRMRLAETYLLRAEAYLGKGDKVSAAADINAVRTRAGAAPVDPGDVTIDYILDERARELFLEEPRRRTLVRLGKLVERTKLYNSDLAGSPGQTPMPGPGATIQTKHELLPIPQSTIAANTGAVLQQNPGY